MREESLGVGKIWTSAQLQQGTIWLLREPCSWGGCSEVSLSETMVSSFGAHVLACVLALGWPQKEEKWKSGQVNYIGPTAIPGAM